MGGDEFVAAVAGDGIEERLGQRANVASARRPGSALIDEALAALLARQRAAEIDTAYAAYDAHPLDEDDEWGNLASFRAAAGGS